jgi:hypothetical protein
MREQDHPISFRWVCPRRAFPRAGFPVLPTSIHRIRDRMQRVTGSLAPMGIPTTIEASDPALLRAALDAYAAWPAEAGDASPLLRIRLDRSDEADTARMADDGAVGLRVDGGRLWMDGGAQGGADAARGEGWCAVPPALAADAARLTAEVLDPLLLFLLTRAGRIPLHASGVVVGGMAAVLAGPSGSGKSTLALAALAAGLPVLSDDTVYVQLRPHLRVWGFPRPIHVFPEDAPAGVGGGLRLRSGRWKTAVPLPSAKPPVADRAALFLLERGHRVAVRPISVDRAVDEVSAMLEPGFDHFREQVPDAVRALTAGGAWHLTLSADPAEALRLLRDVLERGAGS